MGDHTDPQQTLNGKVSKTQKCFIFLTHLYFLVCFLVTSRENIPWFVGNGVYFKGDVAIAKVSIVWINNRSICRSIYMWINKRKSDWWKCLKARKDRTESPCSSSKPHQERVCIWKTFQLDTCVSSWVFWETHMFTDPQGKHLEQYFLFFWQQCFRRLRSSESCCSDELPTLIYLMPSSHEGKNGRCKWQPAWLKPPIKEIKNLQMLWYVRCRAPHYYADGNICSRDVTFRNVQQVFQMLLQPEMQATHCEQMAPLCFIIHRNIDLLSCHGLDFCW